MHRLGAFERFEKLQDNLIALVYASTKLFVSARDTPSALDPPVSGTRMYWDPLELPADLGKPNRLDLFMDTYYFTEITDDDDDDDDGAVSWIRCRRDYSSAPTVEWDRFEVNISGDEKDLILNQYSLPHDHKEGVERRFEQMRVLRFWFSSNDGHLDIVRNTFDNSYYSVLVVFKERFDKYRLGAPRLSESLRYILPRLEEHGRNALRSHVFPDVLLDRMIQQRDLDTLIPELIGDRATNEEFRRQLAAILGNSQTLWWLAESSGRQ